MEATQIWVLTGVTMTLAMMLFWALKMSITQLMMKIETLVGEIKKLTEETVGHHHRLDAMEDRMKSQHVKVEKINDHIRKLEMRRKNE